MQCRNCNNLARTIRFKLLFHYYREGISSRKDSLLKSRINRLNLATKRTQAQSRGGGASGAQKFARAAS